MDLVDTNLVSELRKVRSGKADPGVAAWADGVDASSLFLSAITLHELELGVLLAERRDPTQGALLCHGAGAQPGGGHPQPGRLRSHRRAAAQSLAAGVGQISPDGGQRLRTPPTVHLLCLWAWRGLLAALWAGAEECCMVASGEGLCAWCLLPAE
jgi:hypothetical protein